MGIVLLIFGIILTADALAVVITSGIELGALITLVLGVLLILWGANYKALREKHGIIRFLKAVFKIFLLYLIAASCFLAAFGSFNTCDYEEEYAVVLGCGIRNSQPTRVLAKRLEKAVEYAEANPGAVIIVSGGQGKDENVPEATVMYNYLVEKGVSADRIWVEASSGSTYENFKLSDELYALQDKEVAVITNRFHMFRANFYAGICGIDASTCSADEYLYSIPVDYIRESLALVKMVGYYLPMHFGE
ncbi:MAG: YdcF family protein [Firmicutes bacterium]|nr:YdcF family protein [Bacillota bacterium]